jgi:hypothetical protein
VRLLEQRAAKRRDAVRKNIDLELEEEAAQARAAGGAGGSVELPARLRDLPAECRKVSSPFLSSQFVSVFALLVIENVCVAWLLV